MPAKVCTLLKRSKRKELKKRGFAHTGDFEQERSSEEAHKNCHPLSKEETAKEIESLLPQKKERVKVRYNKIFANNDSKEGIFKGRDGRNCIRYLSLMVQMFCVIKSRRTTQLQSVNSCKS